VLLLLLADNFFLSRSRYSVRFAAGSAPVFRALAM
jgi:hypothetical protein